MRIALCSDWFLPRIGGIEIHVRDLARQLSAAGHRVEVITPIPGPSVVDGVQVKRVAARLFPWGAFLCTPDGARKLARAIREGGYDALHIHYSVFAPTAWIAIYLAHRHRLPAVVTFHSILGFSARLLRALDALCRWSSWPIVFSSVSQVAARGFSRLFPHIPLRHLPNGVDVDSWQTRHHAAVAPEVVVVSVMRLTRKKRPEALLRAFQSVLSRLPPGRRTHLVVIGEGSARRRLERCIHAASLADRVTLCGYLPRASIREVFAASHVFVLPSLSESFGLAALEARSAGLPVLAMRAGGVAECLTDGVEALFAGSDDELADKLLRLVRDDRLRGRLRRHNRSVVPRRFAWEVIVAEHVSCYREAMRLCAAAEQASAASRDDPAKRAAPSHLHVQ